MTKSLTWYQGTSSLINSSAKNSRVKQPGQQRLRECGAPVLELAS